MSVDRAMELALFDEEYLEIRRWSVRRRLEMESLASVRTWKPWFPLALEDGRRGAGGTSGHTNGPLCRRNLGGFHIEDNFHACDGQRRLLVEYDRVDSLLLGEEAGISSTCV